MLIKKASSSIIKNRMISCWMSLANLAGTTNEMQENLYFESSFLRLGRLSKIEWAMWCNVRLYMFITELHKPTHNKSGNGSWNIFLNKNSHFYYYCRPKVMQVCGIVFVDYYHYVHNYFAIIGRNELFKWRYFKTAVIKHFYSV